PDLAPFLIKTQEPTNACVNAPAQMAALAALTGPQDCVREMRDAYRGRRDLAVATLREEGLFAAEPRGAFYVFADISAATSDTFGFAEHLVREHGVAVAP